MGKKIASSRHATTHAGDRGCDRNGYAQRMNDALKAAHNRIARRGAAGIRPGRGSQHRRYRARQCLVDLLRTATVRDHPSCLGPCHIPAVRWHRVGWKQQDRFGLPRPIDSGLQLGGAIFIRPILKMRIGHARRVQLVHAECAALTDRRQSSLQLSCGSPTRLRAIEQCRSGGARKAMQTLQIKKIDLKVLRKSVA